MVAVLVVMVGTVLGVGGYWLFIDVAPPSRLIYQHHKFTSVPVETRADAETFEINEAAPGSTVYRYMEWELMEPISGRVYGKWEDGLSYREEKATLRQVGKFARSIPHTVPPATKRDIFVWSQRIEYKRNPITTVVVEYPKIKLLVVP